MKNQVKLLDQDATKNWKAFSQKTNRPTETDEESDRLFSGEQILENVRSNLLKPSKMRSNKDLQCLMDYFKHVNYFKQRKLKDNDLKEVSRALKHLQISPQSYAIKYGDIGASNVCLHTVCVCRWV